MYLLVLLIIGREEFSDFLPVGNEQMDLRLIAKHASLPEFIPFAMCLFISSHQETEAIFPPLNLGLTSDLL